MADLQLTDYIELTRNELMAFGTNQLVTNGDSTDPIAGRPVVSITTLLNMALREVAFLTKYLIVPITSIALVNGTREYVLPTDYSEVENAYLDDIRLMRTTEYDLSDRNPIWRKDAAGFPTMYYRRGAGTLGFAVKPDSTAATKVLLLVLTKTPTAMSLLNSTAEGLPQLYQDALPARAASLFCNIDAGNDKAQKRKPELDNRFDERVTALATVMFDAMNKDTASPTFLPPALMSTAQRVNPLAITATNIRSA